MAASIAMINKFSKTLSEVHTIRRLIPIVLASVSGVTLLGCGSDTTGTAPAAPLLWSLSLNVHAANLALRAPYDTMQLIATPLTSTGAPLTDTAMVQYSTTDSAVTVSPTGLVTAHYVTSQAHVVARITLGGITAMDTTVIQVVDSASAAPLTSFSIQPRPGGLTSTNVPLDVCTDDNAYTPCPVVRVYATLGTGNPATDTVCNGDINGCTGLLVSLTSSDPTVATINRYGTVSPNQVGRVTFYASTLAYGVLRRDSLTFSIGYRIYGAEFDVKMDSSKTPAVPYIPPRFPSDPTRLLVNGVGAEVLAFNWTAEQVEITLPPAGAHFTADTYDENYYDVFVPSTPLTQLKDTVSAFPPYSTSHTYVEFDSVGVFTLHYRLLTSGDTLSSSILIKGYP